MAFGYLIFNEAISDVLGIGGSGADILVTVVTPSTPDSGMTKAVSVSLPGHVYTVPDDTF